MRKGELDDLDDVVNDGLINLGGRARRGGLLIRWVEREVQERVEHLDIILNKGRPNLHEQV